jgi:hypothetical protein
MSRLFPIGATIGSFFAGFTLNIVVSADSSERPEVRLYASIGSLLFVLLVLLSSAGDVLFAFYKGDFIAILNNAAEKDVCMQWKEWHLWMVFGVLPSVLFGILNGGVFFFLLIMKAYENAVAVAGLVIIGTGMFGGVTGWLCLLGSYTGWGSMMLSWIRH